MSSPHSQAALARAVVASATDFAIVTTDLDGLVTSWNPGAENLLGWSPEEMIGHDASRFFTPEDNAADRPRIEMAGARTNGRAEDERWHMKKDGSRLWASGLMMRFEDEETGEHIGYLKILRDRTPQHDAERRLSESEARWRGLFERLQEGLVVGELIRDEDGRPCDWRYLDVNAAWTDLVGVPRAAAIGRTVRELIPDVEDAWITDIADPVATQRSVTFNRKVGSFARWYEGRVHPLEGDRFTILFQEVTERYLADRRRDALIELTDRTRDEPDPVATTMIGAEIIGQALDVGRVGYGTVEPDGETFVVARDWTAPGYPSLAGTYRMSDYGRYADDLRRGEAVCVADTREDARTVDTAATLERVSVRALINLPVMEQDRIVAVLYVNAGEPRRWTDDELAFVRDVASRLRQAVERRSVEARLRASEAELRLQREFLDTLIREAPVGISITQGADGRLGSGLIGHSQKMTVAARATAEKKTVGHRS